MVCGPYRFQSSPIAADGRRERKRQTRCEPGTQSHGAGVEGARNQSAGLLIRTVRTADPVKVDACRSVPGDRRYDMQTRADPAARPPRGAARSLVTIVGSLALLLSPLLWTPIASSPALAQSFHAPEAPLRFPDC